MFHLLLRLFDFEALCIYIVHIYTAPIAIVRSTNVLLATNPSTKLKQMLMALLTALTLGGNISATTTHTNVP